MLAQVVVSLSIKETAMTLLFISRAISVSLKALLYHLVLKRYQIYPQPINNSANNIKRRVLILSSKAVCVKWKMLPAKRKGRVITENRQESSRFQAPACATCPCRRQTGRQTGGVNLQLSIFNPFTLALVWWIF